MPKETVYGETMATEEGEQPVIEVRWDRETGDVRLVTKCLDALGGRLAHDDPGIHYSDGFHVGLDRRGINRLIANLRRARDGKWPVSVEADEGYNPLYERQKADGCDLGASPGRSDSGSAEGNQDGFADSETGVGRSSEDRSRQEADEPPLARYRGGAPC